MEIIPPVLLSKFVELPRVFKNSLLVNTLSALVRHMLRCIQKLFESIFRIRIQIIQDGIFWSDREIYKDRDQAQRTIHKMKNVYF